MLTYVLIKSAQEEITAVTERGLHTQVMKNTGQLYGDVTATHHQRPIGQTGQIKKFVGGNRMFNAGNIRLEGPATRCDQNVFRGNGFTCNHHTIRPRDSGTGFHYIASGITQQIAINTIETVYFLDLVFTQHLPVKLRVIDRPTKGWCQLDILAHVGSIDIQLFGNTPYVDTGAPHVSLFCYRYPRPHACRYTGTTNTAGPGTNHKQIIIIG